jgi:hypothetical protein
MVAMNLAAKPADRGLGFQQSLRRKGAERQNNLGSDELDLADQIGRARGDFLGQRIPVSRRPMLEDVRDEHIVTGQLDRLDDFREQLARLPDERDTLLVLVGARRFAHDHEVRVGVACTGYRILRRGVERAPTACRRCFSDGRQRFQLERRIVGKRAARSSDDNAGGYVRQ